MTTRQPATWNLADISLRKAERGFIGGGVGSGKSTLADELSRDFLDRYPNARVLVLDSKPRYRAQFDAQGRSARGRYSRWSHGPLIPRSVVVDDPRDLRLAWETGARLVIAQAFDGPTVPNMHRLVSTAREFLSSSKASRPQLVQVDESLDFFHGNGAPVGGDQTIIQLARAGRERGTAVLYCAQRTRGIPATLMGELTKLYAMRIDYRADAKRFQEMGAPPFDLPTKPHEFFYWTKEDYDTVYGPLKLTLPS